MSQTTRPPPPGPMPSSRGNPALGDIVRSVLVLAVALLAVVWVGGWFRSDTVVEPQAVDVDAVARRAATGASYPLLVPLTLPEGWRVTQARWDPESQHWHVGLLTPADEYVGLEQMRAPTAAELVDSYLGAPSAVGRLDVGGAPWREFVDSDGTRTALVSRRRGVTTMVLGPSRALLASFAVSLEPVRG